MDTPSSMAHASVVLMESVWFSLLISELNYLNVFYDDVRNDYINTPTHEKAWFWSGTRFGQYKGRVIVIIHALFRMPSGESKQRYILYKIMIDLGFTPCITDPDVWIRAATKLEGFEYCEYVLIHTDYLLVISHRADLIMKGFEKAYTLKSDPKTGKKWDKNFTYLGSDLAKFEVPDTGDKLS